MNGFLSLLEGSEGKEFTVANICSDDPNQVSRLESLGLVPGSLVSLIAKLPFNGPLAFGLRGTKFAV